MGETDTDKSAEEQTPEPELRHPAIEPSQQRTLSEGLGSLNGVTTRRARTTTEALPPLVGTDAFCGDAAEALIPESGER